MKKKLQRKRFSQIYLPEISWTLRLLLYAMTLVIAVLTILIVCFEVINVILASLIYVLAAGLLGLSSYYFYRDLNNGIHSKVKSRMEANPFTKRFVKDYHYRTVLFTYASLAVNLIFALGNGIFGIVNRSVWFGAMSAYYIVLSMMRFIVIRFEWRNATEPKSPKVRRKELSVYRNCGILLILLTIVLGASVIQMVYSDQGHNYPGTLIFAVAAYTFYKIILSVINVVKAGKLKSPLLMTIKNISYADAVVSMLSLQTAMFAAFGSEDELEHWKLNAVTGGIVCMLVLSMGIYMIYTAERQVEGLN